MMHNDKVMCNTCEFDQGPGKCYYGIVKYCEEEPARCTNYMVKDCCLLCKRRSKTNNFICVLDGHWVNSRSKKCSEYIEIDSPADFRR